MTLKQNYLHTEQKGNDCGGQAMSNKWTKCTPGRPKTKWLEKVNKDTRSMGIKKVVSRIG
jgi:hypothetical protein